MLILSLAMVMSSLRAAQDHASVEECLQNYLNSSQLICFRKRRNDPSATAAWILPEISLRAAQEKLLRSHLQHRCGMLRA